MSIERRSNSFYFQVPELSPDLSQGARVAIIMGSLASRLTQEERTRVEHPDGRAENVAEHSLMLAKVAVSLARALKDELPVGIDEGRVALAAIAHDDPEAYVLDTATDRITEDELMKKSQREARGTRQLVIEFFSVDSEYAHSVEHYEKQLNVNDRFVRMVDKLMTLLIHIPNNATVLRHHYSREEIVDNARLLGERFRYEYPEFEVISDLRDELVQYLLDSYYA